MLAGDTLRLKLCVPLGVLLHPQLAGLARRMAESATESPVEVRQIIEPDLVRDLGDAACTVDRVEQDRTRPLQPLLTDEFRHARALALEEHPHIARAHAVARGKLAE